MDTTIYFRNWGDAFLASMQNLWFKIIGFLPQLIGAVIVLVIGILIAYALGRLAEKLFSYTHIDKYLEKKGTFQEIKKSWSSFSFANLLGIIVRWFFIIATIIAVVNILQINQLTGFLNSIVFYLPNVLGAVIVLAIGIVVGNIFYGLIEKGFEATKISKASALILADVAKWAIVIFSLLAALVQLKIGGQLIQILFGGFVTMVALAGGLAFGLGGKDKASKWLDQIFKE